MSHSAVFLDRDGVLVEDRDLLVHAEDLRVLAGVAEALGRLKAAGFRLIVITNQAVVARGMITEAAVVEIHRQMSRLLELAGAPPLDAFYFCPHHPQATLPEYRVECDCRKPRHGSLLRAAREQDLDLAASFMVGDRITDVICGQGAGCQTVLLQSPASAALPIVTLEPIDASVRPDYICPDLRTAADWILTPR
jgi:D-glycero-D-manno-heptose 1,7-bisphosphate phosphatase